MGCCADAVKEADVEDRLVWYEGLEQLLDAGISGGGVAAVSAPCCPYCQRGEGLPFFPPLPLGWRPLGFWFGGLGFGAQVGGGGVLGCHCC